VALISGQISTGSTGIQRSPLEVDWRPSVADAERCRSLPFPVPRVLLEGTHLPRIPHNPNPPPQCQLNQNTPQRIADIVVPNTEMPLLVLDPARALPP
jgi:hypothetical protein